MFGSPVISAARLLRLFPLLLLLLLLRLLLLLLLLLAKWRHCPVCLISTPDLILSPTLLVIAGLLVCHS